MDVDEAVSCSDAKKHTRSDSSVMFVQNLPLPTAHRDLPDPFAEHVHKVSTESHLRNFHGPAGASNFAKLLSLQPLPPKPKRKDANEPAMPKEQPGSEPQRKDAPKQVRVSPSPMREASFMASPHSGRAVTAP